MPRVSQQYKDDQRAAILAAARRCFIRNGFDGTSMQEVFAEAGKSAGAVYRYFPKKDDIIVGVADQNLADVTAALRTALLRCNGEHGIGPALAEVLEVITQWHAERQIAAMALLVWSEALRHPALADRLTEAVASATRDIADLLRERQSAGAWTEAPADELAQVILAIVPGFLFNLALRGPRAVAGFPGAVRALWPR